MMETLIRWIVRRRVAVVVATLLVTLVLLLQLRHLEVLIDTDRILPQGHPYIVASNIVEKVFGSRFTVLVGLRPKEGSVLRPEMLSRLKGLSDALAATPGAVRRNVRSLASPAVRNIVGNADGFDAPPLMAEAPRTQAEVEALEHAIDNNPMYDGVLVSKDRRTAAVVVDFEREGAGGFREIDDRVEAAVAPFRDDGAEVLVTGQVVYLAALERYSDRMLFFLPLAILIIALLHYEAFRTVQGLVLPLVTALLSVVWGLGFMMLSGLGQLDPFSNITPILIIAVAAGHAVQILKRYYECYERRIDEGPSSPDLHHEAVVEAVTAIGPVMLAAGGIAAASFLSLLVFDIQSIRTFGAFAASGILSALVIELTFIPAVRAMLPPPGAKAVARERMTTAADRAMARVSGWVLDGSRNKVLFGWAVLALLMAYGARQVVVDNSLREFFTADRPFRQADATMNASLAGTNTLFVLVDGHEEEALTSPDLLRGMLETQRLLEADPRVGATLSIADFVARMNRAMHGDDPAFDSIPDSRELVSQYLLLYSFSGGSGDFDQYIDPTHERAVIQTFVRTDNSSYLADTEARLEPFVKQRFGADVDLRVAGSITTAAATSDMVVEGKLRNIVQVGLVVFFTGSLLFRSLVGGAFLLVPLGMVALVNFGLMGLAGIPLQVATATMAALGIGVGADYAIYFTYRLLEELRCGASPDEAMRRSFRTAGKASLYVAAAVGGGYAVLIFCWGFKVYMWMGLLIAVAMATSSASALVLYPALLDLLRPRFVFAAPGVPEVGSILGAAVVEAEASAET